MDFLKILRSLEEFLYEAMTWLVFYPRTLWRIVTGPLKMVAYAREETDTKADLQFVDAISPPLFLMLTIGLCHLAELALHSQVDASGNAIKQAIFGNEQNLLIYRSIGFSIWPLVFAVGMLRRSGAVLNRETLRGPFFAQCYLTAPFALLQTLSALFLYQPNLVAQSIGAVMILTSLVWYITIEVRWVRLRLDCGYVRATGVTILDFATGSVINMGLAYLLSI